MTHPSETEIMIHPSATEIIENGNFVNRYELVIATAQRARQIQEGAPVLTESESQKVVTIAAKEIYENKIISIKDEE